jgi:vacuolar-type H+-ATPase subunit I/STV1
MSDIEQEPTAEQEEAYEEKIDKFGDTRPEEYSGLEDKLGPKENIRAISSVNIKKEDKSILALTNKRLIVFNSDTSKLLGKRNTFEDIRIEDIQDIEVEERKDFDVMIVKTEKEQKKLMTPEGTGMQISGHIRDQQEALKHDPAEQLEKIGEERDKGNISQEEYEDKKDELMDRI